MVGIVGYGIYIPRYRIKTEEIARIWGADGERVAKGLLVEEKSVPGTDEDAATMAVEAARNSVTQAQIDPTEIGAVYCGSESFPYAVKPTATIVAQAICASEHIQCADLEFACKAGSAGIQICMSHVIAKEMKYGMAIGTDCSQGKPRDALEYSASAGAASFIIGDDSREIIAEIEGTYSYTTDTPDFWRREGSEFPRHGSRFTGEPAYFAHVIAGAKGIMKKLELSVEDFNYAVFHMPNGKFPIKTGKTLGIPLDKVKPGLIVIRIGNTYSASSLIGLCRIFDLASPDERILCVSYGSGAGSDAFSFLMTENITEKRENSGVPTVDDYIEDKEYIDYALYAKHRRKIKKMM